MVTLERKLSKFYADGRGVTGADRKKALLLHCAGMDVYVDVTYMLLICHPYVPVWCFSQDRLPNRIFQS